MKNDDLDKHLVFHFQFITKVKEVNNEILNHLKQISKFTINQLRLTSRQQGGFGTIDIIKTNLPNKIEDNFIKYIKKVHNVNIPNIIKKYEYIRVGDKERIYGKLYNEVFYTLIYDKDKKKQ